MNQYRKLFLYVITAPLFLLSTVIPKKNNLWLFGSWKGTDYSDNSKYLFEYINSHHKEIDAVWLTRSKDTQKRISALGHQCYMMYSFNGIRTALRAAASCISRAKAEDMPLYLSSHKTHMIQLWHGTPIKKLGQDLIENKALDKSIIYKSLNIIKAILLPQTNYKYSLFIATSEEVGSNFYSAYSHLLKPNSVKVTGYPRNDIVLKKKEATKDKKLFRGIYLPTFRDNARESSDIFYQYGFDARAFSDIFDEHDITLDIKLHPEAHIGSKLISEIDTQDQLNFIDAKDIHAILGDYDFLVSDYSSIFFDYLLLDRPIVFAPFDYNEFIKDRGLYYDYNEITPGPRSKDWPEVIQEIVAAKESSKDHQVKREAVSKRINYWRDANSCQRVVAEIKRVISRED